MGILLGRPFLQTLQSGSGKEETEDSVSGPEITTSSVASMNKQDLVFRDHEAPRSKPAYLQENYQFQYKFRTKSIAYIFYKELIVTVFICLFLILVNFQYLT